VQQTREAARRTACSNKLKNLGLAVQNFVGANAEKLPMLGEAQEGGHWTAFILPYVEQQNSYDVLSFGSNDFADSAGVPNASYNSPFNHIRNIAVCETPFDIFRCPSTTAPEAVFDASTYVPPWFVARRVPANYIGVVTGIQPHDRKPASVILSVLTSIAIFSTTPSRDFGAGKRDGANGTVVISILLERTGFAAFILCSRR
jgi:hypothetical protein